MFGLGFSEIILLGLLALLLIGPKELPEVARTLGRFINDLKRSSEHLADEIKTQARFQDPTEYMKENLYDRAKLKEEQTQDATSAQMELPITNELDRAHESLRAEISDSKKEDVNS